MGALVWKWRSKEMAKPQSFSTGLSKEKRLWKCKIYGEAKGKSELS